MLILRVSCCVSGCCCIDVMSSRFSLPSSPSVFPRVSTSITSSRSRVSTAIPAARLCWPWTSTKLKRPCLVRTIKLSISVLPHAPSRWSTDRPTRMPHFFLLFPFVFFPLPFPLLSPCRRRDEGGRLRALSRSSEWVHRAGQGATQARRCRAARLCEAQSRTGRARTRTWEGARREEWSQSAHVL